MNAAPLKRRRRVVQDDGPDPIDIYVGRRLCELRLQHGISLVELGRRIGVSFQAVQKYESADMRISASTLYRMAQVFAVGPGYFFEGYAPETGKHKANAARAATRKGGLKRKPKW